MLQEVFRQQRQGPRGERPVQNHGRRINYPNCHQDSGKHRDVHSVEQDAEQLYPDDESELFLVCGNGTDNIVSKGAWNIRRIIKDKTVNFKIVTCAQCNVLPLYLCKQLGINMDQISKSKHILTSYGGTALDVLGTVTAACEYRDVFHPIMFYVMTHPLTLY